MSTLVLRNVPDDLYEQLKETAVHHRRSMTQEAIVSLQLALAGRSEQPTRPTVEDSLQGLKDELWSLSVLDRRSDDEILGYNEHGSFN